MCHKADFFVKCSLVFKMFYVVYLICGVICKVQSLGKSTVPKHFNMGRLYSQLQANPYEHMYNTLDLYIDFGRKWR